jgi:hydrogenase/urease accessory protein HupE
MTARRWAATAVLAALSGAGLGAHPGSTTAVVLTEGQHQVINIALHTDARALVAKLEALTSAPLGSDELSPQQAAARIRGLSAAFLNAITLRADAQEKPVTFEGVSVDEAGQAVVRLIARAPVDARTLRWQTGLVFGAYPISLRTLSGREVVRWVQGREMSEPLSRDDQDRSLAEVANRGIRLGFTHILPHGLDHILFVVGLVLLSSSVGPLLAQISAFTVAHSITLGLCLYSVVSLPSSVVEPLIALSVAYVGWENLFARRLTRRRMALVFAFGLLHGLGFAEALARLNLQPGDFLPTLISFNAGVELGQLTVVGAVWLVTHVGLRRWQQPVARLVSAGVGVTGVVWTVQRVFF